MKQQGGDDIFLVSFPSIGLQDSASELATAPRVLVIQLLSTKSHDCFCLLPLILLKRQLEEDNVVIDISFAHIDIDGSIVSNSIPYKPREPTRKKHVMKVIYLPKSLLPSAPYTLPCLCSPHKGDGV